MKIKFNFVNELLKDVVELPKDIMNYIQEFIGNNISI